jgi:hypothetical protein
MLQLPIPHSNKRRRTSHAQPTTLAHLQAASVRLFPTHFWYQKQLERCVSLSHMSRAVAIHALLLSNRAR